MPYIIKPINNGYKVCKKDEPNKCFSNKPLSKKRAIKQEKAIILSELEGGSAPLVSRIGGKSLLKKLIVNEYFPKDYTNMKYVEPFVGGGSIFFYKEPSKEEVINDKDKSIYDIFKGFQKYKPKKIREEMMLLNKDETTFKKVKDSEPTTNFMKFIKNYYLRKNSFFGNSETFSIRSTDKTKFKSRIDDYYDRLKNVKILNEDYKTVIKNNDSKETFFYLDPPYEESGRLYTHSHLPISDVYDALKNIKGKFLLSYNVSDDAKRLFNKYNIYEVKTKYTNPFEGGRSRTVVELLICNYEPKKEINGGKKNIEKINKEEDETEILDEKTYLKLAKLRAQIAGYNPDLLKLSIDGIHKLEYDGVKFGRKGYNDFIIYMYKAYKGEITKEEALKHRKNYLARASKIKGNWKDNIKSPNNLTINILW